MAFVSVSADLTKIKSKLAFNLTKRQLVCFGTAAAIGIPTYLLTRGGIGNSSAVLLMIGVMLPLFFLAMYERDGRPAEKILRNIIRTKFLWAETRPYKTENLYEIMEREAKALGNQTKAAAETAVRKRKTGKR
jgi:hypothetical protein